MPKKLNNSEEMDKFLEIHNLPRLNHKVIENLNRPTMSRDIESVILNLPTGDLNLQPGDSLVSPRTRELHW